MNLSAFKESLAASLPPANCSVYLCALWYEGRGSWEKAHTLIQDLEDSKASWIHAYLHRKEGDQMNAGYWYRRAGREIFTGSFDKEWEQLVNAME